MHPETTQLLAAEVALRAEAEAMLARSDPGAILHAAGYRPAGSYAMRTMT